LIFAEIFLVFFCGNLGFKINEEFRAKNGLKYLYWFNHFAIEGRVLYLVGEDGFVVTRESIYRIKPKDIEQYHWEQFDQNAALSVLQAVHNLNVKVNLLLSTKRREKEKQRNHLIFSFFFSFFQGIEVNEKTLKTELEFDDLAWSRFSKEVMDLVDGIPNITKVDPNSYPQVLITVGVPGILFHSFSLHHQLTQKFPLLLLKTTGSGKSTFANKLVQMGWERVFFFFLSFFCCCCCCCWIKFTELCFLLRTGKSR
jgi:hypothetical protein